MSKFSYFKELVIPKFLLLIDSLSFTSEGYTRAKNILMTKCGKPNEVANALVGNIISLPHINNIHPQKIHEYSEKLLGVRAMYVCMQVLGAIRKIREIL